MVKSAAAAAIPSMRPTNKVLAPSTDTRNTGNKLWIISEEMSMNKLTKPSAHTPAGIAGLDSVFTYRIVAVTVVALVSCNSSISTSGQPRLARRRAIMTIHFESQLKTFNEAKGDFLKTAKKATATLGRERDRLNGQLKKTNARIKRTQAQLKKKADRLATVSKATAEKTRTELRSKVTELKQSVGAARDEARMMRKDLSLVRRDLADARHHLSHALHIDRAIARVDKAMAKKKAAKGKTG